MTRIFLPVLLNPFAVRTRIGIVTRVSDLPAVIGQHYLFSQQSPWRALFGQRQHALSPCLPTCLPACRPRFHPSLQTPAFLPCWSRIPLPFHTPSLTSNPAFRVSSSSSFGLPDYTMLCPALSIPPPHATLLFDKSSSSSICHDLVHTASDGYVF